MVFRIGFKDIKINVKAICSFRTNSSQHCKSFILKCIFYFIYIFAPFPAMGFTNSSKNAAFSVQFDYYDLTEQEGATK